MTRSLIDITNDMAALDELLAEIDGDISDPRVAEAVTAWCDELDANLDRKVDNYAAFIKELEGRAAIRKAEAERLAALARRDENTMGFLKTRLKEAFESRGMKKLDTFRYCVSVCGNGGKQPLEIWAPKAITKDLCRHIPETWEPDTDKIREAISGGREIDGATLLPRGTHLRIK